MGSEGSRRESREPRDTKRIERHYTLGLRCRGRQRPHSAQMRRRRTTVVVSPSCTGTAALARARDASLAVPVHDGDTTTVVRRLRI